MLLRSFWFGLFQALVAVEHVDHNHGVLLSSSLLLLWVLLLTLMLMFVIVDHWSVLSRCCSAILVNNADGEHNQSGYIWLGFGPNASPAKRKKQTYLVGAVNGAHSVENSLLVVERQVDKHKTRSGRTTKKWRDRKKQKSKESGKKHKSGWDQQKETNLKTKHNLKMCSPFDCIRFCTTCWVFPYVIKFCIEVTVWCSWPHWQALEHTNGTSITDCSQAVKL